jgi:ferredoxin
MPTVKVVNRNDETFEVRKGGTALSGARAAKKDWRWYCGGQALCGTCCMLVVDGELEKPGELEQYFIEGWGYHPSYRLACQAKVTGDVSVIACADEGYDKDAVIGAYAAARSGKPG